MRTLGRPALTGFALVVLLAACGPSTPSAGAAHHRSRVRSSPTTGATTTSSSTSTTTSTTTTTSTSTTTSTTAPPSAVPAGFVPESFTAVSTAQWWLLGHVTCGTSLCPALVTTTNGGQTFERLTAPGSAYSSGPGTTPPISQIRFADPDDGWAYGAQLYATHDGGQHWTQLSLPGTITDLEAGSDHVFAVVTPSPACASTGTCTSTTPHPELWEAQPSSDTWQALPSAGPVAGPLAVHDQSLWLDNATFSKDGWSLGSKLVYSADDGAHFTVEPQAIPGVTCSYQPVSRTDLWAYCSGGHFMDPYLSTDAGAQFHAVGTQTSPSGSPVGCANGSGLIAATPTEAVAACNVPLGSPLLRSDDGGSTWTAVQAGLDKNGWWSPIGFTTDLVGYAFWQQGFSDNSVQLWRTTDGGANWSRVTAIP